MRKIIFFLLLSINVSAHRDPLEYPYAKVDSVKEVYFGNIVPDPYRWLENDTLSETKRWIDEEMELSKRYLNRLKARYDPEKQLRLNSHISFGTISKSGRYYFDMLLDNGIENEPSLYIKKHIHEDGIKIVDPADYKTDKKDRARITDYKVANDSRFIAFNLSHSGSDWQEIRVKSLYPFHTREDIIKGVKFSGVVWGKDGFFYKKYPQHGNILQEMNLNSSIWYHKLGTDQNEDSLIFRDPAHPYGHIGIGSVCSGNYLVIDNDYLDNSKGEKQVMIMDLGESSGHKIDTLISTTQNARFSVIGWYRGKFLVHTTLDAPKGKVLLFDKNKKNSAEEFIPQYKETLREVSIIGPKVLCTYIDDIDYKSVTFDSSGNAVNQIVFPTGSSVSGFEDGYTDSTTIFYYHSFLHPPIVYEYNVNELKVKLIEQTRINYDHKDFVMEKVYYNSKDGEKIPMIIACRKTMKKNGDNPTLLYGYGGNGIVMTPFYNRGFISFMQNGGIVALPCLRGGGEYGEQWHESGSNFNKQNVFDDFIGAAEFLSRENYTNKKKLAIMGGSNGGLLVAAVLNQRPDICKVAIAEKGVYDMLRYQKFTIGHMWENEYGSSNDSSEFKYLYQYSPYHNIKDTVYPAVLVVTADHDDRVVPLHSYKYVAALQKKNTGDNPILLYSEANHGHGGSDLTLDVYIYSFIYDQLGVSPTALHNLYY
jgi:prolyl oligopeptidase